MRSCARQACRSQCLLLKPGRNLPVPNASMKPPRRSSASISLVLIGAAALATTACRTTEQPKRDVYTSRKDCEQDWNMDPGKCEPAGSSGESNGYSTGHYWGPMYYPSKLLIRWSIVALSLLLASAICAQAVPSVPSLSKLLRSSDAEIVAFVEQQLTIGTTYPISETLQTVAGERSSLILPVIEKFILKWEMDKKPENRPKQSSAPS